jgi:hypothetical protein
MSPSPFYGEGDTGGEVALQFHYNFDGEKDGSGIYGGGNEKK